MPLLPDLNLPSESPEQPYQPLVPLVGSLSREEEQGIERLIQFENQLLRNTTLILESLKYSPKADDIKNVIETFLIDITTDNYDRILLNMLDTDSPLFQHFLNDWDSYLIATGSLVQNVLG